MKKIKEKLSDKRWMLEFSKKMLIMLSVCYGLMLIFTMFMMIYMHDITILDTFIQQVTMVFSLGVVSYLIKSAVENVFKIKGDEQCSSSFTSDQIDMSSIHEGIETMEDIDSIEENIEPSEDDIDTGNDLGN